MKQTFIQQQKLLILFVAMTIVSTSSSIASLTPRGKTPQLTSKSSSGAPLSASSAAALTQASLANMSMSLSQFITAFQAQFKSKKVNTLTLLYDVTQATQAPDIFVVTVLGGQGIYGFSCFQLSNGFLKYTKLATLIAAVSQGKASWAKGIQFVVLGFDAKGNLLSDITNAALVNYGLCMFNDQGVMVAYEDITSKGVQLDGRQHHDLSFMLGNPDASNPWSGINYPAVVTLKSKVTV